MITIITEKYYPEGGGAEIVTHNIVEGMLQRGYRVTIITGTKYRGQIKEDGLRYIYEPLLRRRRKLSLWLLSTIIPLKYRRYLIESSRIYIPGILYPIIPYIKKINRDAEIIVHMHNYQAISYSQFYLDWRKGGEKIVGEYMLMSREYGYKSILALPLSLIIPLYFRRLLSYADKIITPSKSFREIICRHTGIDCRRIYTVYNPVNIPRVEYKHKSRQVIYLGGEKYIKGGLIPLVVALKTLRRDSSIRFILAGYEDIPYRFNHRGLKFYGKLKYVDAIKLIAGSSILLFPSIIVEPCPMSILEALHLGTFVVGFDHLTIRELLSHVGLDKYLCRTYDLDCLADKIIGINSMGNEELSRESFRVKLKAGKIFNSDRSIDEILRIIGG